jgi:transcriptional regulator with XRE-family HTH domain
MKYYNIHIGELIKQKFEESKLTITEFAKAIQSCRTNVYNIFNLKSIDTDKLILISEALDYNFFEEYIVKDSFTTHTQIVLALELKDGECQIKQLKKTV